MTFALGTRNVSENESLSLACCKRTCTNVVTLFDLLALACCRYCTSLEPLASCSRAYVVLLAHFPPRLCYRACQQGAWKQQGTFLDPCSLRSTRSRLLAGNRGERASSGKRSLA